MFRFARWIVVFSAIAVYAQSPLGTVTGVAADETGAPVPAAAVSLASEETGVKVDAKTNESGTYNFPNLRPGRYKLTANAQGFRALETTAFAIAAYQTVRQDLNFLVASASTEVTVSEPASAVIQTDNPSINNRLSSKQILELPTNLRSVFNNSGDSGLIFTMMPLTIPGVTQVGAGAAWLTPGAGANGVRLKVDGIDTNFGNFGGPDPVSQPSLESVEEFTANVLTNRAEFSGQGAITTVTKSGTNQFHGVLFWYPKNSAFDARNFFAAAKPFQNIHNYGGALGGPVLKDRTFFFTTYDATRGVRAVNFSPSLPSLAVRAGNFSGQTALRNPYTGQLFEGNQIPAALISEQARRAQNLFFPQPNFGAPGLQAANYRASFNGAETHHIFEARLDHYFTSGHSLFARYQWKKDDYEIPGARSLLPPQSTGTSTNLREVNFWTLGDIWAIRPNIYNEFRAGVVILDSDSDADNRGQDLLNQIGIQGLNLPGVKGIPNFNIAAYTPVTQLLLNPVIDGHWQWTDNLTWTSGTHTAKFGVEMIRWFVNRYLPVEAARFGNYSFTGAYTGNAYGDFLLGLPQQVTQLAPYPTQYNRFTDWNFYAQDDWKLTPRLTLSYGLRYEYNGPAYAEDRNVYSFDPGSGSIVVPGEDSRQLFARGFPANLPVITGDRLDLGKSLRNADRNNFAPRFGFSYGASSRTVVRGGWGLYYGHFSGAVPAFVGAGPYSVSTTSNNTALVNGVFPSGQPAFTLANPFAAPGSAGTVNLNAVSPDLRNAYTMQYSLTVEQELQSNLGVRISYIGSKGSQLPYQRNINQPLPSAVPFAQSRRPYPLYNNIIYAENGANSLYGGLQAQVFKRFSKGLLISSAWTWAKSLSEVDDTGNAELNTAIENAYDRARDRADVYAVPRHQWLNQILYELPFRNQWVGGWQLNALINLSSGNFLNPQWAGVNLGNTNVTTGRPDAIAEVDYPESLTQWFDRAAFAAPPASRFGTAARNSVVGPGYIIVNFGVAKNIRFERFGQVQVGAMFQNALNHTNFGQPNMTASSALGGTITSTHIFPAAGSARSGQLSLRYSF